MLWPLVLPFQITCGVLILVVLTLTVVATPRRWSRVKSFLCFSTIALIGFIPSCTGIMTIVDTIRFGDFQYASFGNVPDFRSQRYLPRAATNISMRKHANGYLARYSLSADAFHAHLDKLWKENGEYSAEHRGGFGDEGSVVNPEAFNRIFAGLGWECPSKAVIYYSPSEADGGGATYYFDTGSGLVFQRTGFW